LGVSPNASIRKPLSPRVGRGVGVRGLPFLSGKNMDNPLCKNTL
jgi:hypothetical protein